MPGRPTKAGLDYFELDCHMEEKVRLIQAEFGLKGFAIVVKLYQKIYGEFGYYCEWNDDSLLLFMSENGVASGDSKNLICETVAACIRRNIFSAELFNKFGILTSEGVQKRYLNAVSKREKIELKKEYLLISVPENMENVAISSIFDEKSIISDVGNAQSRVEESKVEESRVEKSREEESRVEEYPPLSPLDGGNGAEPQTVSAETTEKILARLLPDYHISDYLRRSLSDWIEYKKERRDSYKERGLKSLLTMFETNASKYGDEAVAEVVQESIANRYQGITWDKLKRNQPRRTVFDEWRDA